MQASGQDNVAPVTVPLLEVESVRILMRIFSCVCGLSLTLTGGYTLSQDVYCSDLIYVIAFYLMMFGVLIMLAELRVTQVRTFAHFLAFRTGRGSFYIFCGTLCMGLSNLLGSVVGIVTTLVGLSTLVLALYVRYQKKQKAMKQIGEK